jgi:HAE1 family hydrophobic/amphiphilic exporter-1
MNRHRFYRFTSRTAAVIVAAAGLAASAPAFAQTSTPRITLAQVAQTGQSVPATPGDAARPTLGLSMDQAVAMAFETNLVLRSQQLNPASAAQDLASARAAYAMTVGSTLSRGTTNSPPSDFTQGSSVFTSNSLATSTRIQQLLPFYGANYQVTWSGSRSEASGIQTFNPSLNSSLNVSVDQPLLRNFKTDSARNAVTTATTLEQVTDLTLKEQMVQLEETVRLAYLQLVGALQQRDVARTILDVSETQLKNDQKRVDVGALPRVEIVGDEASVASNEEGVIIADAAIASAEDNLRALILDPARADYWTVRLDPTDPIQLAPRQVDVDQAIHTALGNRADLQAARKSLGVNDLSITLLRNQRLPQLDFTLNYTAVGKGGTQFTFGSGFPPAVLNQTTRSFGTALGDSFSNAFPSWTYGLSFSYPIGQHAIEASLAKARVQKTQAELTLKNDELQVAVAVRQAARNIDTALKRVHATQTAQANQELLLDAAQKKFDVGLATNFEVLQDQQNTANARVAALNAILAYNQALIIFDLIQK